VHLQKGVQPARFVLNGRTVEKITAFLFPTGGDEVPHRLAANGDAHSVGSFIYGRGFLFDDNDEQGSPLSVMRDIVSRKPHLGERIKPFVGGEEFNTQTDHSTQRFVIFLSDLKSEEEILKFDELAMIVREKVKPVRDALGNNPVNEPLKRRWWAFQAHRPDFYSRIESLPRLLGICRVSQTFAVSFVKPGPIFGESVVLFALPFDSAFAVMQSRAHELWARFFSSTMGDALRYAPSDCFETFPFPAGFESNAALESAGREYYEFRAALMQDLWLGLTEIYNLFHTPDDEALARLDGLYRKRAATPDWRTAESIPADRSPLTLYATPTAALAAVQRLRTLHAAMDAAVLTAYGWTDLLPKCTCEFLLDYEDEDSESAEESSGRKKKKPWRYRWPDEIRDEVLARLLKLNAERAAEEAKVAAAISATAPKTVKVPRKKKDKHEGTPSFL
jgi:hypothetical protein